MSLLQTDIKKKNFDWLSQFPLCLPKFQLVEWKMHWFWHTLISQAIRFTGIKMLWCMFFLPQCCLNLPPSPLPHARYFPAMIQLLHEAELFTTEAQAHPLKLVASCGFNPLLTLTRNGSSHFSVPSLPCSPISTPKWKFPSKFFPLDKKEAGGGTFWL